MVGSDSHITHNLQKVEVAVHDTLIGLLQDDPQLYAYELPFEAILDIVTSMYGNPVIVLLELTVGLDEGPHCLDGGRYP